MLQTVEGEILLTARNLTKEVFGEIKKELREFSKEYQGAGENGGKAAETTEKAFESLGLTIGSVAKLAISVAGAVGAAAFELEQIARNNQLEQKRVQIQMREQGVTSQEVFDGLKEYAETNSKAWHMSAEDILAAEGILTRTGETSEAQIKELTQRAADIAASGQENIKEVAAQIADSSRSSGAALSFLDKHHVNLTLRQQELIQAYGQHKLGAQQLNYVLYLLGNGYQGNAVELGKLKGTWDTIRVTTLPKLGISLGDVIEKTGFFEGAAVKLNNQLESMDDYLTGKKSFKDFLGSIDPQLAATITELQQIDTLLEELNLTASFTQAVEGTKRDFNAILGVLNDIKNMGPLGALVKLGVGIHDNSPVAKGIENFVGGKSHITMPLRGHAYRDEGVFVNTRAAGGPFDGTTLVGEHGPELVTGKGYVQNANQVRAMLNASKIAEGPTKEFAKSVSQANEELAEFSINLADINRKMQTADKGRDGGGGGGGRGGSFTSGPFPSETGGSGQGAGFEPTGVQPGLSSPGRRGPSLLSGVQPGMGAPPVVPESTGAPSPPGKPGTYRAQYNLTERDTSPEVIRTIAGEARRSQLSTDAVINNMLNRVGSKGWGQSKDIYDVATAPGQYEAYWKFRGMKVPEDRANFIRERLKAVASGEVADPTHGANSYRADSYAFGEGRSREWMRKYGQYGVSVGGNRFAKITDPGLSGPFASHEADPAARTSSAAPSMVRPSMQDAAAPSMVRPSMVRPSMQDAAGSSLRQVGNYRQGDPFSPQFMGGPPSRKPFTGGPLEGGALVGEHGPELVTGKGYVQNANQVRAMLNASKVAEGPTKDFSKSVAQANEELAEFSINLADINRKMQTADRGGGGGGGGGFGGSSGGDIQPGLSSPGPGGGGGGGGEGGIQPGFSSRSRGGQSEQYLGGSGRTTPARGNLAKNQQEAYNAFRSLGYDNQSAKIATANFSGESLANPANKHWDYKHFSQGIAQWDDVRSARIQKQFGKTPAQMSVPEQVKAFDWEAKNFYSSAYKDLRNEKLSEGQRMYSLVKKFESPANPGGATATRLGLLHGMDVKDETAEAASAAPSMVRPTAPDRPRTAPSMVRPSLQDAAGSSLRQVGNYKQGVDPRLTEILNAASKDSPYKVEAFSGYRPGDPRFHGQGKATDIRLVDRETGKALANYQTAGSFREYEKFAQHAREIQQQTHPELDKQFRWGGYFGGGRGKYGAMDEMHFDLGGSNRLGMAGGSWEKGLTPEQRRRFAGVESVGMASARPSPMQMASARPDPQTLARPDPASFAKSEVGGQPTNVQLGRGMIDVRLKLDKDLKMSMPKVTPGSQFDLGVNVDRTGQFFSRPGDPSVPIFGGSAG